MHLLLLRNERRLLQQEECRVRGQVLLIFLQQFFVQEVRGLGFRCNNDLDQKDFYILERVLWLLLPCRQVTFVAIHLEYTLYNKLILRDIFPKVQSRFGAFRNTNLLYKRWKKANTYFHNLFDFRTTKSSGNSERVGRLLRLCGYKERRFFLNGYHKQRKILLQR